MIDTPAMRRIAILLLAIAPSVQAAPEGFQVDLYSDKVQNPTAFCFDDSGKLYVTETHRWRVGIEDNRDHTYWIMDDLATETTAQRVAYYNKYAPREARRCRLLHPAHRESRGPRGQGRRW